MANDKDAARQREAIKDTEIERLGAVYRAPVVVGGVAVILTLGTVLIAAYALGQVGGVALQMGVTQ